MSLSKLTRELQSCKKKRGHVTLSSADAIKLAAQVEAVGSALSPRERIAVEQVCVLIEAHKAAQADVTQEWDKPGHAIRVKRERDLIHTLDDAIASALLSLEGREH